jgi:hypothetical protein
VASLNDTNPPREDRVMVRSPFTRYAGRKGLFCGRRLLLFAILFVFIPCGSVGAKSPGQKVFRSPIAAVEAVVFAARADDTKSLLKIFGSESKELILSGDPVEDNAGRDWFVSRFEEKHRLEQAAGRVTLHVGNDDWPFPIPLVKAGKGWKFDTRAGKEEILARRIGRNELSAIQVCLAYVDAQKEYAMKEGRRGADLLEYAQRFVSTSGKHDGLYWEAKEGEEQSPMGPLFAAAKGEGYGEKPLGGKPAPYHGYFYRILTAQGNAAPGGAHDYLVGGKMIGGFALIAFPARYGSSGIMTFMVNQDGVVYQKDLGKETSKAVLALEVFDPDRTWSRVPE